jgi:hypothetical protein
MCHLDYTSDTEELFTFSFKLNFLCVQTVKEFTFLLTYIYVIYTN